ncbi:MAG: hypothetical protein C0616_06285 [Desulfuromonas sp.]|nr:MAG: hypothetical protein C0616_06285 [Desulfuromonas sp.]
MLRESLRLVALQLLETNEIGQPDSLLERHPWQVAEFLPDQFRAWSGFVHKDLSGFPTQSLAGLFRRVAEHLRDA